MYGDFSLQTWNHYYTILSQLKTGISADIWMFSVFTRHSCLRACEKYLCLPENSLYAKWIIMASQTQWVPENTNLKACIIPELYINHATAMSRKQEFRYSIHMHMYTHTVSAFNFVQRRRWDILKNVYIFIYFPLKLGKKNLTMPSFFPKLLKPDLQYLRS